MNVLEDIEIAKEIVTQLIQKLSPEQLLQRIIRSRWPSQLFVFLCGRFRYRYPARHMLVDAILALPENAWDTDGGLAPNDFWQEFKNNMAMVRRSPYAAAISEDSSHPLHDYF